MKTKYVLRGFWEDGTKVYYQETLKENFCGYNIKQLTTAIDYATQYDSIEDAEKVANELHDPILKIYPVCPICGEDYDGHPAISRKDNKSEICSECGMKEAIVNFINTQKAD